MEPKESGSFKNRVGKIVTGAAVSCEIKTGTFSFTDLDVYGDLWGWMGEALLLHCNV